MYVHHIMAQNQFRTAREGRTTVSMPLLLCSLGGQPCCLLGIIIDRITIIFLCSDHKHTAHTRRWRRRERERVFFLEKEGKKKLIASTSPSWLEERFFGIFRIARDNQKDAAMQASGGSKRSTKASFLPPNTSSMIVVIVLSVRDRYRNWLGWLRSCSAKERDPQKKAICCELFC